MDQLKLEKGKRGLLVLTPVTIRSWDIGVEGHRKGIQDTKGGFRVYPKLSQINPRTLNYGKRREGKRTFQEE
jgi:hypothetical protein